MNSDDFIEKTLDLSKNIDVDLVKKFVVFNEISSTNSKAKELAQCGEAEGTVVIAQMQKSGRGRFDRIWESPEGGLYLSIILKPDVSPDKTTLLPLVAALAVSTTIRDYDLSVSIKWPNDVRINSKKVAGILLESDINSEKINYVIIGIGVNLNSTIDQFPTDLKKTSTSVFNELACHVDYHKFLVDLLSNFERYYSLFIQGGYDSIISEWKKASDTLGKQVKIVTSSSDIVGMATDIDNSGFLLVKTESGEQKKIMSGDCVYCNELSV